MNRKYAKVALEEFTATFRAVFWLIIANTLVACICAVLVPVDVYFAGFAALVGGFLVSMQGFRMYFKTPGITNEPE